MVQKSKGAIPMYRRYRLLTSSPSQLWPQPQPRPLLVSRYATMNPLLRLFSLQMLAAPLPDPLRSSLIRAWMQPGRYDGNQAIQSRERQRLPEDVLFFLPPARLGWMTFMELGASRRIVEVPRTEITGKARNALLRSQGAYLAQVYAALVAQLGEAGARRVRAAPADGGIGACRAEDDGRGLAAPPSRRQNGSLSQPCHFQLLRLLSRSGGRQDGGAASPLPMRANRRLS
jgi:hypothetical protein